MSAQEPVTSGGAWPSRRTLRGAPPSVSGERRATPEAPRVITLPDAGGEPARTISLVDGAEPGLFPAASGIGPDTAALPARLQPTGPMSTVSTPVVGSTLIGDPRTGALRLAERSRSGPTAGRRRILSTPPVSFDAASSGSLRVVGSAETAGGPREERDPFAPPSIDEETQLLPRTQTRAAGSPVGAPSTAPDASPAAGSSTVDPGGGEFSRRRRARGGGAPEARTANPPGRSGRNLPMAILVGAGLGGAVLASLLIRKEAFVGLVSAAIVIALWEMAGALAAKRIQIPVVPLVVGALGMLVSAYVAGEEGLLIAFALTAFGVLLWRIIDGLDGAARDISAGVFTAAYVPFMAAFSIVMLAAPDGALRVIVFVAVTVASDVGGLAAGVRYGRHPMAPSVSPRKSWEGLAGSLLACMIVATAGVIVLLDGPWWAGFAVGAAVAVTATIGDLAESLLKRDLGVKDMGSLLPGHGGMMDRLDSLLLTAPVSFLLLAHLVPSS